MTAKRGLEGAIHTIQAEVDAMLGAAKNAEEKAKKAMVDAARLADELRAEQDHASSQASSKQSLNNQLGQLEGRLADAENAAAKGGKAAMAKLENKIRELEAELASTQARTGESGKAYQRAERKCKELVFSSGEDKKNQDRMTDLASSCSPRSRPTSSRSRKPRRSPPSTWPSSGRLSRSWRRLRSVPSWLPFSNLSKLTNRSGQLNLEKNLTDSVRTIGRARA